jgi:hypothetical protein
MTDLVEAAQKVNNHTSPPRELISGEPFHMLSLFNSISNSHPTERVVPSINTLLCTTKKTKFWLLRIDNHIWFSCSRAAECLAHPCSSLFFLDLWRVPSGSPYFVLYGFQLYCYVLCGLVPACGPVVVWRSIRSLRGFGNFSPTLGRIQPLLGIKHLPAACSNLSCYETYCREDRAIPRTFVATVPVSYVVNRFI